MSNPSSCLQNLNLYKVGVQMPANTVRGRILVILAFSSISIGCMSQHGSENFDTVESEHLAEDDRLVEDENIAEDRSLVEDTRFLTQDDIVFSYTENEPWIQVSIDTTRMGPHLPNTQMTFVHGTWTTPDGDSGDFELSSASETDPSGEDRFTTDIPMVGLGTYSVSVTRLIVGDEEFIDSPFVTESMTLFAGAEDKSSAGEASLNCPVGIFHVDGNGGHLLQGGAGTDTIFGKGGKDVIYGHACSDSLYGGEKRDTLHGGSGNDYLHGGQGSDACYGNDGVDTFVSCANAFL